VAELTPISFGQFPWGTSESWLETAVDVLEWSLSRFSTIEKSLSEELDEFT